MYSRSIDSVLRMVERVHDHAPRAAECFLQGSPQRAALEELIAVAQRLDELLKLAHWRSRDTALTPPRDAH
jgi:hypothetical protein